MNQILAILAWWLCLELIGWAAWPLTATFLGKTASRGAAFAKHLGLLLTGYLLWFLVSFKVLENTRIAILLVVALVAGISLAVARRERLKELWRAQRREILVSEILFIVAFLGYLTFRAYDPAINHTEKPMDFGFLNAILRSRTFPPNDMWLSGYAISYYYFGYLLMASLTKLSGVPSGIGYNLALGTIFALTITGAYGLVRDLVGGMSQKRAHAQGVGLLGALFVGIVGNLEGFLELLHTNGIGSEGFWRWVNIPALNQAPMNRGWLPGLDWWWWRATRLIQDVNPFGKMPEVIVEFPAFSFILGDMHPHVMALPFGLLALEVAWNLLATVRELPEGRPVAQGRFSRLIWPSLPPLPILIPLVVGALGFLNSWDLPTYGLIAVAAYASGRARRYGVATLGWASETVGFGALVFGAGVALYLPFYIGFRSQAGGLAAVTYAKTPWLQYVLVFGLFLAVVVPWLLGQAAGAISRRRLAGTYGVVLVIFLILPLAFVLFSRGLGGAILAGAFSAIHAPVLAVAMALLLPLAVVLLISRVFSPAGSADDSPTFALLLALTGLLLTYGTEFVYIRDHFGTRMNTMFKFYYQAWVLLGVAAAWGVGEIIRRLTAAGESKARLLHRVWLGAVSLLLLAGLYYPVAAGASKAGLFRGQPTLDGTAWIEPNEAAAMAWLQDQVGDNTSVILEAPGDSYQATQNRVSAVTGLSTVLGWGGHEGQWGRDGAELSRRAADIEAIYLSPDPNRTRDLLRKYSIEYVYVGPFERQKYGLTPAHLRTLDRLMDRVYDRDGIVIYRTREQALKELGN